MLPPCGDPGVVGTCGDVFSVEAGNAGDAGIDLLLDIVVGMKEMGMHSIDCYIHGLPFRTSFMNDIIEYLGAKLMCLTY